MPRLGETVVDGTVTRWHKQPGDLVEKLEPLLDISTDKIDTEVPAPAGGVLLSIEVAEGSTVQAGEILAYIGEAGELAPDQGQKGPDVAEPDATPAPAPEEETTPRARPGGRDYISPVVARMAQEHELDLAQIQGTGLHGRITKKDIESHLSTRLTPHPPNLPPSQSPISNPQPPFLHPHTPMRRRIAQHMSESVRTSPHVVTIHEADMSAVIHHREAHKGEWGRKGIRLTFTPYFVAAVAHALGQHPRVNSRFTEEGLLINPRIHIGVAVDVPGSGGERDGDGGLLVPVIRDADERNLMGLARAVNELAEQARLGRLAPDDLQGGTFTLTNHGVTGSLLATPIINQPQAGILGVGAIVKRPVVRSMAPASAASLLPSGDDAILIRPICYLSFSFDHRVLNGAEADRFVQSVVNCLEGWGGDGV
jgi:2-oxoglutarate dehydrogenase E2 component (dihydrolipoamide succinyltransferase)